MDKNLHEKPIKATHIRNNESCNKYYICSKADSFKTNSKATGCCLESINQMSSLLKRFF